MAEHCTFGPGVELKSSFVFAGTKLAHFNCVCDSVLGSDVNLEARSIVCNYRNDRLLSDRPVRMCERLVQYTANQDQEATRATSCEYSGGQWFVGIVNLSDGQRLSWAWLLIVKT